MSATRLSDVEFLSSIDPATLLALAGDAMAAVGCRPVAVNSLDGSTEGCLASGRDAVVVRAYCQTSGLRAGQKRIVFSATTNGIPDLNGIGRACIRDVADSFADSLAVFVLDPTRVTRVGSSTSATQTVSARALGASATSTAPRTNVVGPMVPGTTPSSPKSTVQQGPSPPAAGRVRPDFVQPWASIPVVTRIFIAIYAALVVVPLGLLLVPDESSSSTAPSPPVHPSSAAGGSASDFDIGACVNQCIANLDNCNPRPSPQCAQSYRQCTTSCTQARECEAYRSQGHLRSGWPGHCQ